MSLVNQMIRLATVFGSLDEALEREIGLGALKIDCLSKTFYFCISGSFLISLYVQLYEENYTLRRYYFTA